LNEILEGGEKKKRSDNKTKNHFFRVSVSEDEILTSQKKIASLDFFISFQRPNSIREGFEPRPTGFRMAELASSAPTYIIQVRPLRIPLDFNRVIC
jgi:hypothetical protein